MPKVYLKYNLDTATVDVLPEPSWDSLEVEMNNSLYRQIRATERKYWSFQRKLHGWYDEVADGKLKRISNR